MRFKVAELNATQPWVLIIDDDILPSGEFVLVWVIAPVCNWWCGRGGVAVGDCSCVQLVVWLWWCGRG